MVSQEKPITLDVREYEPIPFPGMLFTAYAKENPRGCEHPPRIEGIFKEHTCYVKLKSPYYQGDLELEMPFRFLVVAGPFTRNHHNYANVIPFRPITSGESTLLSLITSLEFNLLKDVARGHHKKVNFASPEIEADFKYLEGLRNRGVRF